MKPHIALTLLGASRSIAASLLSACNDSLEMAINMHMEGVDLNPEEVKKAIKTDEQLQRESE
jgi:hypothetical protein